LVTNNSSQGEKLHKMEILTNERRNYLKKLLSVLLSSNSRWNIHPQNGGRAAEAPPSGCYQKTLEFRPLVLTGKRGAATMENMRKIINVQAGKHFLLDVNSWSRSTSCFSFLTLHKSWDKIQPTEHVKLNLKVKQHL